MQLIRRLSGGFALDRQLSRDGPSAQDKWAKSKNFQSVPGKLYQTRRTRSTDISVPSTGTSSCATPRASSSSVSVHLLRLPSEQLRRIDGTELFTDPLERP